MRTLEFAGELIGTDDSIDTGVITIPNYVLEDAGIVAGYYQSAMVKAGREAKKAQMGLAGKSDFSLTDEQWEEVCKVNSIDAAKPYLEQVKIVMVKPSGEKSNFTIDGGWWVAK